MPVNPKTLTWKSFLPGIAWFFVILILITLPGEDLPEPDGWWRWINLIHFDKLVHMGIFAVQVLLFMWPVARTSLPKKEIKQLFLWIALAGCLWGLGTELIQKYLVPSRSFDLVDWTADSIGALAGYLFGKKWFIRFTENTKPTSER